MGSNRREPWVLVHAHSSGHMGQQQLSQAGAGSGALGISGVQTQFKWRLHFSTSLCLCACFPPAPVLWRGGFCNEDPFFGLIVFVVLHPLCWIQPAPNPFRDLIQPVSQPCVSSGARVCIPHESAFKSLRSIDYIPPIYLFLAENSD